MAPARNADKHQTQDGVPPVGEGAFRWQRLAGFLFWKMKKGRGRLWEFVGALPAEPLGARRPQLRQRPQHRPGRLDRFGRPDRIITHTLALVPYTCLARRPFDRATSSRPSQATSWDQRRQAVPRSGAPQC